MDTIDLIKEIKFNENGLAPAIVQDFYTKQVLMLAYMNEESIKKTIETKYAYFFSRSRNELWKKVGQETSEVIIASKNKDKNEIIYELSDLTYHVLVLMIESNINLSDIKEELSKRWS